MNDKPELKVSGKVGLLFLFFGIILFILGAVNWNFSLIAASVVFFVIANIGIALNKKQTNNSFITK